VLEAWPSVETRISKTLDSVDTGYNAEDVLTALQLREMQLWVHPKAVAVTQIIKYPRFKTLLLRIVSGDDMGEWIDSLMNLLEAYGRAMGCKYGEQWGRKGWLKVNQKRGYNAEVAFHVMRKEL